MMERVSFDRNIVQYYGACLNEDVPLLVMEYMAVRCCPLPFLSATASQRLLQILPFLRYVTTL